VCLLKEEKRDKDKVEKEMKKGKQTKKRKKS
jgi:hypothetical protein